MLENKLNITLEGSTKEEMKKSAYDLVSFRQKRSKGVTYYLEAISDGGKTLSNKQMIKVSTGTIPDVPGLPEAINKKWNIASGPNDNNIPRMYVQDVKKSNVPDNNIPYSDTSVKNKDMQENKNNAYIPENDNSHYTGKNSDILEKLQKRMNVVYNPSLSEARYIPATKKGEKDTIYIRNDKDIIHEVFHSIARARRNGVISAKKYNSLYNSLVNSKFFTENILLNKAFKKSLFNEDNGFEPDTAENIGTYDEFYDAMYELYADEYRSDYEKQGYSGNELDNLVSSAVEEEIFAFALQLTIV